MVDGGGVIYMKRKNYKKKMLNLVQKVISVT